MTVARRKAPKALAMIAFVRRMTPANLILFVYQRRIRSCRPVAVAWAQKSNRLRLRRKDLNLWSDIRLTGVVVPAFSISGLPVHHAQSERTLAGAGKQPQNNRYISKDRKSVV